MVGYFINMLPLRASIAGDLDFTALLRLVGGTVLGALEHQDYPFPLLVEKLKVERDPSRAPLVQVSFTQEKAHRSPELEQWGFFVPSSGARLSLGNLEIEPYYIEQHSSQCDLEMVFEESNTRVEGMLRFNHDLFEAETVQRMVGHFTTILNAIADNPARKISELPWLTDAERRLVLDEWNSTTADFEQGLCLHHLFERHAQATPDAIAVSQGARRLSYAELDAWSNQQARDLCRHGAGPSKLVALCFERSPEMIAAILATLKSGAAYVPLDPAAPPARLQMILADTRPSILFTCRSSRARLADAVTNLLSDLQIKVLCTHESDGGPPPQAIAALEGTSPDTGVRSTDIAYVMHTSGSTGRPKGVMVEHRAICNTILWRQKELTLHPRDVVLNNLSYTFDPSLALIFQSLASGARMALAERGEEFDPHRLLERVLLEEVTILETPLVLLRVMLEDPLMKACRTLRWICCGGEAMPPGLPARLFELLDVKLFNLYGPTETAVDATCWPCRPGSDQPLVPIGRPISNVQAYILDPNCAPVAPGVPGELYLGGAGLARGYLNAPGLTADRFIANPFSKTPGARLYRTGDRCRWLKTGEIEFLGRLDHQVKVRGHRIELGEVERALLTSPSVREAAVAVDTGTAGASRLVAYVAARDGSEPVEAAQLRRHLKDRLPEYMIPSIFITLEALPRTQSEKLDRAALPPPPRNRPKASRSYLPPSTPLEQFLAGLWRETLQLEKVGTTDDFFELGGNSIGAAMLVNRIQQKLGHRVSVLALFESPTIAGLAHELARACPEVIRRVFGTESLAIHEQPVDALSPAQENGAIHCSSPHDLLVALQPEGRGTPWFMVHPPGGIVVCYQALAHRLGSDRPFYGIRSRGLRGEPDLPGTLEDMAAEYLAAVRAVQPRGPYLLGGWSAGGLVALEIAQQLRSQGESILMLALLDTIPEKADDPNWTDRPGVEYGLELSLEQLSRLGPDEQLPYLWQHALKLGLIESNLPMSLVHQVIDDLKRVFHHHMVLTDRYILRPYPGRVTLLRPSSAPVPTSTPHDRGWGRLASKVDVHFVAGQHHSMVKEPHVEILAQTLATCLRRAEHSQQASRQYHARECAV